MRPHRLIVLLLLAACATPPPVTLPATVPRSTADMIEHLRVAGERMAGSPFLGGNQVRLLRDGPATYRAMADAIGGARQRIDMESYEFDPEEGAAFAALLRQKRAQGVAVHLIYDAWGSIQTGQTLFDQLRAAGAEVLEYNPLRPNERVAIDINRRDHRKLLVVDGSVAITGGVNVSKYYLNRPNGSDDPERMAWRDTDVRIEGPAVREFQRLFLASWAEQHGAALPPPPPTPGWQRGGAWVQAIDGAPVDGHPVIYETLLTAMSVARHSVHLTTGFFGPTPEMEAVLRAAAQRGVAVVLVVPGHSNSRAAIAAGRSHYAALLAAGVRIFERAGVVLHAKTAVIDGVWSCVGSSNLDWRSVVWNNEIDAVVIDQALGMQLEALFTDDMAQSREITPAAWAARPLGERLSEFWASTIESLL